MIIKLINKAIAPLGFTIKSDSNEMPIDIKQDNFFLKLYNQCKPYTQTSVERLYSLYQSCNYVIDNNIEGDFVECGVWKGGSSMMIALTLLNRGVTDRKIYMYDTYEGMSEPSDFDVAINGEKASNTLQVENKLDDESIWCYASFDEVKKNILSTGYSAENIEMVKGKVEDTLPNISPETIALLRLDTDWYESTKMELEYLYPKLSQKAPLIIDDFGHWEGAKKAVIEYFQKQSFKPIFQRIDFTGRLIIKTPN